MERQVAEAFVASKTSIDAKVLALAGLHLGGFIASDDTAHIARNLNTTVDWRRIISTMTSVELNSLNLGRLDGVPYRDKAVFVVDFHGLEYFANTAFRDVKNISTPHDLWNRKTRPDNCTARKVGPTSPLYELETMEEFGFVKIGNWWFTRTIQPYAIDTLDKLPRQSGNTILAIPVSNKPAFIGNFTLTPVVGGGVSFTGHYAAYELSDEFKEKYGLQDVEQCLVCHGTQMQHFYKTFDIPEDGIELPIFSVDEPS